MFLWLLLLLCRRNYNLLLLRWHQMDTPDSFGLLSGPGYTMNLQKVFQLCLSNSKWVLLFRSRRCMCRRSRSQSRCQWFLQEMRRHILLICHFCCGVRRFPNMSMNPTTAYLHPVHIHVDTCFRHWQLRNCCEDLGICYRLYRLQCMGWWR